MKPAPTHLDPWNLPPPPGFWGLREDLPLTVYVRHLPHWRQDGATYFVTFRLSDSLPRSKLDELNSLRTEWVQRHPQPDTGAAREDLMRRVMTRVEKWLDQGLGSCWLREPEAAECVAQAMHYFDGDRYELGCYAIMPNHVHAVVRPLTPASLPLEKILQSWKQFTGKRIRVPSGRALHLWQEESFDRIIRDPEHLYRAVQYVGNNPRRADLPVEQWRRWIRPEWERIGWRFDDQ
jgi:REP element-mobilizing transposase RayT